MYIYIHLYIYMYLIYILDVIDILIKSIIKDIDNWISYIQ